MIQYLPGVSLDTLQYHNLEKYRGWRNDYRVWKWCRQNDLISEDDQGEWFSKQREDKKIRMYEILNDAGEAIGVCGLTDIDLINRRAEFSLYLAPDWQGAGYGTRALRTLLSHGFNNLGLNLIWGETFEENPALEIFKKLGMKIDGTRREFYFREGRFIDAHLVSITAEEWGKCSTSS